MDAPAFPARWQVSEPELIAETFSSRIWKVRREDGSPAIVKALKPFDDVADELRGEHFLAWRRGEGAVRLLGRDGHSMLLEYGGDTLLSQVLDEQGDNAATAIAADMMAKLFSPSDHPYPPELQPLGERFASLFKKAATDRVIGDDSLYVEAGAIADRLLANPHDIRPLHGDLHHENILRGPRGWLVIDPKGVLGDPGFDAANSLQPARPRCTLPRPGADRRYGRGLCPGAGTITGSDTGSCHRLWLPVRGLAP